ncbi:cell wall-binding repeat-containing protein [Clostridium magnum]|uniref:N-acetylmuramoyl-L-alanine amidase LytC n=1 Tax=Clostridium magnum DSM 2767 TaxID=1121326 RepID=A0A162T9A8_9CLOT|nr:cell wall-binding repeat-containing protein [Clostridium magnum]KZL92373.1 N-acetylmuramoyl-L-alanine amidase LytC precursor [Clostridium magnum DSM 2767]SHH11660.1 Putative cell wall binding repeat 2 [Clostridium magnum DSM 2767]
MKRVKLLVVSCVLGTSLLVSTNVFAKDNVNILRLAGQNRYGTSDAIVSQGWSQSDYAVLVNSENFPDAITSSPLAKKYDAPILLTDSSSLTDSTRQELENLGVKNVFIIGGTAVVSSNVENNLENMGISVKRIWGQDRYETSLKVAKEVELPNGVFVVSGEHYEDALSVAPIAAELQYPIVLISRNNVPDTVLNYTDVIKNTDGHVVVVGGEDVLNSNVISVINPTEIYNQTSKYNRNLALIDDYRRQLNLSTVYIASNKGFADALSGSALAGRNGNPIILVGNSNLSSVNNLISYSNVRNVNVLGGTGVLSDYAVSQIIGEASVSREPSEIVLKDTDNAPISTGVGEVPSNELWLTYSDGTEELLVSSHDAEETQDIVAGISNPQFSIDKKKIYFMSEAWATSASVHVVDIETKSEHFVCDGNYFKVIQNGPYAGNLIVNQHRYYEEGGSYNDYYIVSPEGEQISDLGDSSEVLSEYE